MTNVFRGFGHALAALTTNGSEFRKAWENVKEGESRWRGEWRSEVNGHHGALRCVLKRIDEKTLSASFRAHYLRFLRVCYSVQLRIDESAGVTRLQGQTDLGALAGGVYSYDGQLSQKRFVCNYRCRYDHGEFDLHPAASEERGA